ncbi:hypothetical protein MMC22_012098 [Lobaria immixta]|nr:hypothetical protein [Lobaria immixta]
MKAFTISSAVALLAAAAHAAPAQVALSRAASAPALAPAQGMIMSTTITVSYGTLASEATIRFEGADPDAYFDEEFPLSGKSTQIQNRLSVSHIKGASGAKCVFHGVDGSVTHTEGDRTVDVGPPQTQLSGSCKPL